MVVLMGLLVGNIKTKQGIKKKKKRLANLKKKKQVNSKNYLLIIR